MKQVEVQIPEIFNPLLQTKIRYKLFYGGRGGGKSYAFADSLLLKARENNIYVLCIREVQDSIKESVYKLLGDRIKHYNFTDFRVKADSIENMVTGSKFVFKGMQDTNNMNIKSFEGVDICWIEEAQKLSAKSWEILDPTIRKEGSEIWISMNREEERDPIWKAIAVNPDDRTFICRVNYTDNPFCPDELKYQAEKCQKENYDDYCHIWLGEPRILGNKRLISTVDVHRAQEPKIDKSDSPLVVGVDIAREGDDKTAICFRRGRWQYRLDKYTKLDTVEVANILTNIIKEHKPARIFLDAGLNGYGVYDILSARGYGNVAKAINFGGQAINKDRYANKRAEMWGELRDWLHQEAPVQIVSDDDLAEDLVSVEIKHDKDGRLLLEKKEDVKKRIKRSPDSGDALALTFAEPVYENRKENVSTFGNGNVSLEQLYRDEMMTNSNTW
ncbi:MAG: PBSX family phage terminase large subunit [Alphaproteobacteria bacterium]|nr:PBSX family phage terminase large subunit [Alphaproteobacteria bacterium]